jgi:HD superfamily phosphohydrolase
MHRSDGVRDLFEYSRKVRDPIYNYIELTEFESLVIDTPVFQRLDRISQMHSVHKVYPGAAYSRKVHSLGAMHLIGKAITRLLYLQDTTVNRVFSSPIFADSHSKVGDTPAELDELDYLRGIFAEHDTIDRDFIDGGFNKQRCQDVGSSMRGNNIPLAAAHVFQVTRLVGLLHDLGHGPFSHKLEHIDGVDFDHEEILPEVIDLIREQAKENLDDPSSEVEDTFENIFTLAEIIIREPEEQLDDLAFFSQLVNFPFDCDMLDYIVRDAHFAGTPEYGETDAERIIKGFVVDEGNLKISISEIQALRNAFESIFDMYRAVYTHKTVRMYDIILEESFTEVSSWINRETESAEALVEYDDNRFVSEIKEQHDAGHPDFKAAWDHYRKFRDREKPYKELFYSPLVVDVKILQRTTGTGQPLEATRQAIQSAFDHIVDAAEDHDVKVTTDSLFDIRRAGLSLEDLYKWVSAENLHAPEHPKGPFITFYAFDPDLEERLTRLEIPVRIYIERSVDSEIEAELEALASEELDSLQEEREELV